MGGFQSLGMGSLIPADMHSFCPSPQVSINFDPFMFLTLPLPIKKQIVHKVFYVPADISKPRYEVCLVSVIGCSTN